MHSLLENYLSEVAAQLGALPVKQRREELREMRAHLENSVIVSRELGQSEDAAAQNAVVQFGTPLELGQSTVASWQRGVMLDRRSFWGAALFSLAVLLFVPLLSYPLVLPYLNPLGLKHFSGGEWLLWLVGIRFTGPIVAGAATGLTFSKRAPLAGIYGPVLYFALCVPACFHQLANVALLCVSDSIVILLIAWAGSRFRLTWGKRRRLAQVDEPGV